MVPFLQKFVVTNLKRYKLNIICVLFLKSINRLFSDLSVLLLGQCFFLLSIRPKNHPANPPAKPPPNTVIIFPYVFQKLVNFCSADKGGSTTISTGVIIV